MQGEVELVADLNCPRTAIQSMERIADFPLDRSQQVNVSLITARSAVFLISDCSYITKKHDFELQSPVGFLVLKS